MPPTRPVAPSDPTASAGHGPPGWLAVLLALLPLLLSPVMAGASEIQSARVRYQEGTYILHLEARMRGDADTIRHILTDYDHNQALNEAVRESALLQPDHPDALKARIVSEDCAGVFCVRMTQVQEVRTLPNGDLEVTIIPAESDFSAGHALWHITSDPDGTTLLVVDAEMTPRLWVPPVVGPPLVAGILERHARSMAVNLEVMVREHPTPFPPDGPPPKSTP